MTGIADVPSVLEPPADAEPSEVWAPFGGWSRRSVLAAIGGAAVASGMGVLDLLPWSRPRAALAASTVWNDCTSQHYWTSSQVCYPASAYFSNTCAGVWHRNDGASGSCYAYKYTLNPTSCDGRNAWKWQGSARLPHRMCSDGYYSYETCGAAPINRFSICRTAL
jgi:hypothetical protein